MIVYKSGNILDDDADVLVNPVNCVGVMGAGLAKQFKEKFPEMFKYYKQLCADNLLDLGNPAYYRFDICRKSSYQEGPLICLFPTKYNWKDYSKYDQITELLPKVLKTCCRHGYFTIALPKLGCGLGGLKWSILKPRLEEIIKDYDELEVRIYGD